ncbi:MAG TPA: Holliday junction branch migration protein RuvA [Candidatus Polarisedimenticolia bacterium]|jgi:Holliday junction DNA helicase RuvA|nr:Holliday junction branch migration protein RuvA [Candidatus Polarisedimenticolia bacterium]
MIARLCGTLVDKQPGTAVVDVGGVGYQVSIPLSTYGEMGEPGSRVELHVHTHVREDALALFGFHTRFEKDVFTRLLAVSGIGPRTALAVLSGLGAQDLIEAVRGRDVTRLSSVPGVGRKTAERMVVDLADRIDSLAARADGGGRAGGNGTSDSDVRQDLVSALVNLGYNVRVAADAAGRVLESPRATPPPFHALLRETLKILSR